MSLVSSYDPLSSRLTIYLDDETLIYGGVSPYHNDQVYRRRRNKGVAIAYLHEQGFTALKRCPVCSSEHLDRREVCGTCGWQESSAADHPNLCDGGPNWAPLDVIKKRWASGERDTEALGRCPMPHPNCRECPSHAHPEVWADQETG